MRIELKTRFCTPPHVRIVHIMLYSTSEIEEENDLVKTYRAERQKYKQNTQKKKGSGRESDTMTMLQGFQSTLSSVAMMAALGSESEKEEGEEEDTDEGGITW